MGKKINELINKTYKMKKKKDKLEKRIATNNKKIQSYFDKKQSLNGETEITTDENIKAQVIESVRIDYDIPELEKRLRKKLYFRDYLKVFNKVYTVKNWQRLKMFLKQTRMRPKELKHLFEVSYAMDKKALNNLFKKGVITAEDLKGTVDAKIIKYVKYSATKKAGDGD